MPDQTDARFHEGIRLFNAREYFEAHEVWEELWHEMTGTDRRFVQGLIQAAVCVYHADNGNIRGALRLFDSACRYMTMYGTRHWGIDIEGFWQQMANALAAFRVMPPLANPKVDCTLLPILVTEQ